MKTLINDDIFVITKDLCNNKVSFPKNISDKKGIYLLYFDSFCINIFWNGLRNNSDAIELPYHFIGDKINEQCSCKLYYFDVQLNPIKQLVLSCLTENQFDCVVCKSNILQLKDDLHLYPCLFCVDDLVLLNNETFHVDSINDDSNYSSDIFFICDENTTLSIITPHPLRTKVIIDSSLNTTVALNSLYFRNSQYVQIQSKRINTFTIEPMCLSNKIIIISPLLASFHSIEHLSTVSISFPDINGDVLEYVTISQQPTTFPFKQQNMPIVNSIPMFIDNIPTLITSSTNGFISPATRFIVGKFYSFSSCFSNFRPILPSLLTETDTIEFTPPATLQLFNYCVLNKQHLSISLCGNIPNCFGILSFLLKHSLLPFHHIFYDYCVLCLEGLTPQLLFTHLLQHKNKPTIILFIGHNQVSPNILNVTKRFIEDCERFQYPIISLFHPSVDFTSNSLRIKQKELQLTTIQQKKMFGYLKQRKTVEDLILGMSHPIKPLKPSGFLLYGPSGCGKTCLMEEFCLNHPELNIKVVRGSEVLSKYVGESERKVRDLFDDDVDLIVFDDFDSLGHKRDGEKTDSVVNTLLTMIDGVSTRKTTIVALTNRPDLIDPALLRGGRLGDWIYLGLPTLIDKSEALKELCGVEWDEFDQKTPKWTMADIVYCLKKTKSRIESAESKERKIEKIKDGINKFKPSGPMIDLMPIEGFIKGKKRIGVELELI